LLWLITAAAQLGSGGLNVQSLSQLWRSGISRVVLSGVPHVTCLATVALKLLRACVGAGAGCGGERTGGVGGRMPLLPDAEAAVSASSDAAAAAAAAAALARVVATTPTAPLSADVVAGLTGVVLLLVAVAAASSSLVVSLSTREILLMLRGGGGDGGGGGSRGVDGAGCGCWADCGVGDEGLVAVDAPASAFDGDGGMDTLTISSDLRRCLHALRPPVPVAALLGSSKSVLRPTAGADDGRSGRRAVGALGGGPGSAAASLAASSDTVLVWMGTIAIAAEQLSGAAVGVVLVGAVGSGVTCEGACGPPITAR
jgi:hypothetical protein